ncbi:hypothetical protein J3R82DRAFT_6523 [Butyriboletus roseoflavus]|nr:hypothetical protein J3R82DRAFT_6523 [Butyriboletus roseoflavus]
MLDLGPIVLSVIGGTVHEYGTPKYNALIPAEIRKPGSRAAIVVDVYQVSTSCGYAVPLYDFVTHRTQLLRAFDKFESHDRFLATSNGQEQSEQQLTRPCDINDHKEKGAVSPRTSLRGYWLLKNMRSLDGLPGLATAPDAILIITPQSQFDKDTRPRMRHRKGVADVAQEPVFGDRISFASGFIFGAVAMVAFAAVWGS